MTVIGSNISALRAANASSSASAALAMSSERLSTGKRINSAKDDAAGLAIASRMTSQIKSMAVAVRNANDGISMAQTAEGALGEVTSMLQRMKELATQSANGTLGASERKSLQSETDQLTSQINDIAKTTNFNGQNLLDGSVKGLKLQTGTNSGDTVSLSMGSISTNEIGLTAGGAAGQSVSGRIGDISSIAVGDVTLNGVNAIATAIPTATTANTAQVLAAAINENSDKTGVRATASNSVTSTPLTATSFAAGDVTIGGRAVGAAGSADELVANINRNDFGVTATLNSDKTITLSNTTGKDITVGGKQAGGFNDGSNDVGAVKGFVSLQSVDGKDIKVGGTDTQAAKMGLNLTSDGVSFTGTAAVATAAALTGDLKINGVAIGTSTAGADATATGKNIADAINLQTAKTGVVASSDTGKLTLTSADGSPVRLEGTTDLAAIKLNAQGGTSNMTASLDISTQASASAAMAKIDAALDKVSATRGDLGAIQNRLQVTVNNLTTTSTNLSDAKGRIEDTDFSAETTALAKAQILSQASTAMLAQANQSQQSVLKLLQ